MMSEEDGYDILYGKYLEGSALVKKYRQKITALRDENEKLKKYNRKLLDENIDLFNDRNKLRADKRELVEACEGIMHLFKYFHWTNYNQDRISILQAAVAKHREE